MTARLTALDLPGGVGFVERLERIWDDGDAAFVVDQRLPPASKVAICDAMRVGDEVEPGDAIVVATSGSTGTPKGVVLTHDAIRASAEATSRRLAVTDDDHWLACLPLSHVGGLSVVMRSLHTNTRLSVMPEFDATAVDRSAATLVSLVSTALRRVDTTRFRMILLGGSRPPADRPANTVATYGMTETGSGVVYDGRPLDGVEVHIDAADQIWLRCPMLMRGYRNLPSPIDPDGWFPTGDLGRWVSDPEVADGRRLHVDGRRGDLIISGGENIWPETVEAAVRAHPSVADVMVRGVPDDEWGQLVEAVVVPAPGAEPKLAELRDHVKGGHPAFMAPRRLVLAEALPKTALGKLRRSAG